MKIGNCNRACFGPDRLWYCPWPAVCACSSASGRPHKSGQQAPFDRLRGPNAAKAAFKRKPASQKSALEWLLRETKKGEFGFKLMTINSDIARQFLGYNKHNRNVSRATVGAYARDMKQGNWLTTGDPIRFDVKGHMIDGQHRLEAIIEAGIELPFLVVYGLDEKARYALDMGRKRNPADMLALKGYTRVTRLSAAARWLHVLKFGKRRHRATHAEIMRIVDKHPKLPESVERFDKSVALSPSMLAAVHLSWAGRPRCASARAATTSKTTVMPRPAPRATTATFRGPNSPRDPSQSGCPTPGQVDGQDFGLRQIVSDTAVFRPSVPISTARVIRNQRRYRGSRARTFDFGTGASTFS